MLMHGKKGSIPVVRKTWVIIGGESNSGGLAFNSEISTELLQPDSKVQIWNNTSNNNWQPLQIGVNNLLGHSGLSDVGLSTSRHGFERAILENCCKKMYLTKTGQGGSRINQWLPADSSGYYNVMLSRINAGIASLSSVPYTPIYVWCQGVNDALDGNVTNWETLTAAHFTRVRSVLGANTAIVVVQIMGNTTNKQLINSKILSLADSKTFVVDSSNAGNYVQSDTNHWDTTGFNIVGTGVVNAINNLLGVNTPFRV